MNAPRFPKMAYTHAVEKRNKRLFVVRQETGEAVYTPPDFIRIDTRDHLRQLASKLDGGGSYIDAVMDFESSMPRRKQ